MSVLDGKTVLVTGGTGSFGRRFVETALREHEPKKLIVFSRDELKQYEMQQHFGAPNLRYFLGDVRDRERLYRALDGVDIVVHAAALKQIPACEYNPLDAIKTNVLGAANIIDAAIDCGVEKVIALSTDKAAGPVNLYGATKLCSDKLFIAGNAYSGRHRTRFSVVRYGNVVGSRGSVVPFFKKCRERGVLPITDERMTRFWITLDQGVRFVIQSLELMHGGELFVPKIPSTTILDLAEAIAPGCQREIIGIRPGEKLHEMMISIDDARHTLELEGFYVIQPAFHWWESANWQHARPVPEEFVYASDSNTWWLTIDEIREMVGV